MLETDLRRSLDDARVIVAYTDDADSSPAARQLAFDAAERTGAQVILYALGDASPLESPTPTAWSGSRSGDQEFSDPLTEEDAEMLGRAGLAGQLQSGAERGIEARAWVPDEGGVDAMIDYARRHAADVVLLPEEHEEPGLLERLTGAEPTDQAAQEASIPVLLVGSDGSLRDART